MDKMTWKWAGHIARMMDNRWTIFTVEQLPSVEKRM